MRNRWLVFIAAIVGIALVAANKPIARRYITIPGPGVMRQLPFSNGVLVGNTLYLAGTIGLDPKTGKPPADTEQEARFALDNIQTTLKEAGMTMDDLVYVQVFCSDVHNFDKFNSVYRGYFKKEFPARAFVGAGTLLFGGRFEVQAIAVKRD